MQKTIGKDEQMVKSKTLKFCCLILIMFFAFWRINVFIEQNSCLDHGNVWDYQVILMNAKNCYLNNIEIKNTDNFGSRLTIGSYCYI